MSSNPVHTPRDEEVEMAHESQDVCEHVEHTSQPRQSNSRQVSVPRSHTSQEPEVKLVITSNELENESEDHGVCDNSEEHEEVIEHAHEPSNNEIERENANEMVCTHEDVAELRETYAEQTPIEYEEHPHQFHLVNQPQSHSSHHTTPEREFKNESHEQHANEDDEVHTHDSHISEHKQHEHEDENKEEVSLVDDDFLSNEMPSLEKLRAERVSLTEQIRHHKDEQDSLALDIECQEGAESIYRLAARLHVFEQFCHRAAEHIDGKMKEDIDKAIETDRRHSEEEIASYARFLQQRRDQVIKRISAARAQPVKGRHDATMKHITPIPLDDKSHEALSTAIENERKSELLLNKVKCFRTLHTKLTAEIAQSENCSKQAHDTLEAKILRAKLDNERDIRQGKELNTKNSTLTTVIQVQMAELNAEHYGVENMPSEMQLLEARNELQQRAAIEHIKASREQQQQGVNDLHRHNEGDLSQGESRHTNSMTCSSENDNSINNVNKDDDNNFTKLKKRVVKRAKEEINKCESHNQNAPQRGSAASISSRASQSSKPPLVSIKKTASQRQREAAAQKERTVQQTKHRKVVKPSTTGKSASTMQRAKPKTTVSCNPIMQQDNNAENMVNDVNVQNKHVDPVAQ